MHDLIIIGAGPAGLSASYEANKKGIDYICLEADKLVSTINNYPLKKTLFAFGKNVEIGKEQFKPKDAGKVYREEVLAYYESIAKNRKLNINLKEPVKDIKKHGNMFQIVSDKCKYEGKYVLLAIGMQACPRYLGIEGEDLDKVHHRLKDPTKYKGKNILVVGGGNTAIEAALALAENKANVTLSYRKEAFFRLSEHNHEQVELKEKNKEIRVIYNSNLTRIKKNKVRLEVGKDKLNLDNDITYILIGSEPSKNFLEKIGLHLEGVKPGYNPETYESNIKGLYVAGDLTQETLIHNAVRHGREIVTQLKITRLR